MMLTRPNAKTFIRLDVPPEGAKIPARMYQIASFEVSLEQDDRHLFAHMCRLDLESQKIFVFDRLNKPTSGRVIVKLVQARRDPPCAVMLGNVHGAYFSELDVCRLCFADLQVNRENITSRYKQNKHTKNDAGLLLRLLDIVLGESFEPKF